MKCGAAGLAIIKDFEKLLLVAYAATEDERRRGIWTIGYGHTRGVKEGDTCTEDEAEAWLAEDVAEFEDGVNRLVTVPLTQNQFDALVAFAFNVGLDIDEDTKAEGLGDSTLLKKLNAGDYKGAAAQWPLWNKQGTKILGGLVRRRAAEQALFRST